MKEVVLLYIGNKVIQDNEKLEEVNFCNLVDVEKVGQGKVQT